MRKSERKLILVELITIFILILNIFVKNILNEYALAVVIALLTALVIFLVGYEKEKILNKKPLIIFTTFYTICFLIVIFGLGLFLGYQRSGYSFVPSILVKNILPIILVVLTSEFYRYCICKKGEKNKLVLVLSVIMFILIDVQVALHAYDKNVVRQLLEMLTAVFFPSLVKNVMLTIFSYRYGLTQNIIYRLISELYVYFLPIVPALGIYLESVFKVLSPALLLFVVTLVFDSNKNKDREKEKKNKLRKALFSKFLSVVLLTLILLIIALYSNLFRFWIATIGSGSMTPTFNIGDVVIIDKYHKDHLNELKVGHVLVFKEKNSIYTHRIVKLVNDGENYYIYTKGDREGNEEDSWIVENDEVIGVVKFKIPYIGLPSVWLNRIMEENDL